MISTKNPYDIFITLLNDFLSIEASDNILISFGSPLWNSETNASRKEHADQWIKKGQKKHRVSVSQWKKE